MEEGTAEAKYQPNEATDEPNHSFRDEKAALLKQFRELQTKLENEREATKLLKVRVRELIADNTAKDKAIKAREEQLRGLGALPGAAAGYTPLIVDYFAAEAAQGIFNHLQRERSRVPEDKSG
jgi:hypothetical protein